MSANDSRVVPPLFSVGEAQDKAYLNLRDLADVPHAHAGRAFSEELWRIFHRDADEHFLTEVRRDFDARFWEMYLTCTLRQHASNQDYRVTCEKPGPDVLVEFKDQRFWIEAITVTDGDPAKPDAPIEANRDKPGQVPDEKILLRYANAIDAKYRKLLDYRSKGIVSENDSYVIALNAFPLSFKWAEPEIPRVLKAVFPLGQLQFIINRKTMDVEETRHQFRPNVFKKSGADVSTMLFLDERYAGISAVLHSYANACIKPEPLGIDFLVVHNPLATKPIPLGFLPADREYTARPANQGYEMACHKGLLSAR